MKPTPVLTAHARQRCAEMGISTKVAKRILRHAEITRPARPDEPGVVATSSVEPTYAVVYLPDDHRPVILTVLFNATDFYARNGATFIPIGAAT